MGAPSIPFVNKSKFEMVESDRLKTQNKESVISCSRAHILMF